MIGKDASIYMDIGKQLKKVVSFLSSSFINSQATGFSEIPNIMLDLNTLKKPLSKVPIPKLLHHECQIKGCVKNNIKIFHIRALHKKISSNFVIASVKISNKKMLWLEIVENVLGKKLIPLCSKHHLAIYAGQLFLEDIKGNSKSFKLLNSNRLVIRL